MIGEENGDGAIATHHKRVDRMVEAVDQQSFVTEVVQQLKGPIRRLGNAMKGQQAKPTVKRRRRKIVFFKDIRELDTRGSRDWMDSRMILHFINGSLIFPLIYAFVLFGVLPAKPNGADVQYRRGYSAIALDAELTKVVIRVEVAPAQPGRFGHPSEYRMPLPLEIALLRRDDSHQCLELCHICSEVDRLPAAELLIDFRPCEDSSRPRQGKIEYGPLEDRPLMQPGGVADRLRTCHHVKGVDEVAHHLVR